MSRLGRYPLKIPTGVNIDCSEKQITITGSKGKLTQDLISVIKVRIEENDLYVDRFADDKNARSKQGLIRSLIKNMIDGVTEGFQKELEIIGVGYRANLQGKSIELQLGYSNPVNIKIPDGLEVEIPVPTKIVIRGIDKQQVGEFAAEIRDLRKPEPYKGKGIRYVGEYVRRKAGKTAG